MRGALEYRELGRASSLKVIFSVALFAFSLFIPKIIKKIKVKPSNE